jgi:hypothetical protein
VATETGVNGVCAGFAQIWRRCSGMRGLFAAAILIASSVLLSACSTSIHDSADYYRHSLSQLSTPMGGGDFMWFDVKLTPEYPDNNEAAETVRMQWLTAWLANRKMCMNGYDVIERREFEFLEHNPAQYDLRYKVQCEVVVPDTEDS